MKLLNCQAPLAYYPRGFQMLIVQPERRGPGPAGPKTRRARHGARPWKHAGQGTGWAGAAARGDFFDRFSTMVNLAQGAGIYPSLHDHSLNKCLSVHIC